MHRRDERVTASEFSLVPLWCLSQFVSLEEQATRIFDSDFFLSFFTFCCKWIGVGFLFCFFSIIAVFIFSTKSESLRSLLPLQHEEGGQLFSAVNTKQIRKETLNIPCKAKSLHSVSTFPKQTIFSCVDAESVLCICIEANEEKVVWAAAWCQCFGHISRQSVFNQFQHLFQSLHFLLFLLKVGEDIYVAQWEAGLQILVTVLWGVGALQHLGCKHQLERTQTRVHIFKKRFGEVMCHLSPLATTKTATKI